MAHHPQITLGFEPTTQRLHMLPGIVAMGVTILIWASFALSARTTTGSALGFADVAMIRTLVPLLVFLPFLPARLRMFRNAGLWNCIVISVGAGIPFFALAAHGAGLTSAAHLGALIPGTMPIFVALILWYLIGEKPARVGQIALAVIIAGAFLLIVAQDQLPDWRGICMLLAGSVFWASFSVSAARSGLDPVGCALLIALSSFVFMVLLLGTGVLSLQWGSYSIEEALPFFLVQGLGAGVIASLTYAFAVTRLGPAISATIGALTPVLTACLAVFFLNETLPPLMLLAIGTICTGVILFNRS